MAKALVTGGAGFIGSHLVDALLDAGHTVIALDDLSTGRLRNLAGAFMQPGFELWAEDVGMLRPERMAGVDAVYHLAAAKKTACLDDPARDCRVNALGTLHLLECARTAGVGRLVVVSTGSVYGESSAPMLTEESPLSPVSIYGVSKLAGEGYARFYAKNYGMNIAILRYFHVYGPRQDWSEKGGVVSIFAKHMLDGQPFTVFGDGMQERTFTFVRDVVRATIAAEDWASPDCPAFNVSSAQPTTLLELIANLAAMTGKSAQFRFGPPTVGDIRRFCVSNEKLRGKGFRFEHSLEDGLKETVDWFRNEGTQ